MPALKDTVEFSARVPFSEYEVFKSAFPQYGATNWFINTVLRAFNQRIAEQPDLKEQIDAAIKDTLELSRMISKVRSDNEVASE